MSKYEPRTLERGEVLALYRDKGGINAVLGASARPLFSFSPAVSSSSRSTASSPCRRVKGRVTLDTAIIGLARAGSSKLHMDIYQRVRVSGAIHGSAVIHCL